MTLADFTSAGLIVPRLRGQDVAAVIQELSQGLQREGRVPDLLRFYQAALDREGLVSTDMEAGMAFPHARLAEIREVAYALGRSFEPMGWSAKAARPVRLVFLIAVPAADLTQYLPLVSGFARLAKTNGLVEQLHAAPDAAQMLEVLRQVELRPSAVSDPSKRAAACSKQ